MKQGNIKKAVMVVATTTMLGAMSVANAGGPLKGTKCWTLDPVVGKPTFVQLTFKRIGNKQSIFSGQAVRADGSHGERVLKMSGSTSKYTYLGTDDAEISLHLLDITSSAVKLSKDPAAVYNENGHAVLSHYSARLDPDSLNGAFSGLEHLADFPGGLTGPAITYHSQHANNAYATTANNYLGSVSCDGTIPGYNNCGTILPVNNAGTLTLVGRNKHQCNAANPFND